MMEVGTLNTNSLQAWTEYGAGVLCRLQPVISSSPCKQQQWLTQGWYTCAPTTAMKPRITTQIHQSWVLPDNFRWYRTQTHSLCLSVSWASSLVWVTAVTYLSDSWRWAAAQLHQEWHFWVATRVTLAEDVHLYYAVELVREPCDGTPHPSVTPVSRGVWMFWVTSDFHVKVSPTLTFPTCV